MKRVTIYGGALAAIALVFAAGVGSAWLLQPKQRALTQSDIDSAVLHTLHTKDLPSRAARAAEAVRQSVVEVRAYPGAEPAADKPRADKAGRDRAAKPPPESSAPSRRAPRDETAKGKPPGDKSAPETLPDGRHIGTGVVVTESGVIITNYHVVAGARRVEVRFHDGHTAEAALLQAVPEKDLAILQPKSIPDDLPPATLGSSRELAPGSEVVAVGFPFGIGPSVTAGVVSGLDRQFVSPDDKQRLDKLIQFDAAANPGNSGGPLVNMKGEVVGIVTAILNPNQSGNFLGIGFAITIESAGGSVGASPF
ncbi:trypsin-like peptidase domain-containing protein [Cupriavidus gilardii]|uniref:S1C family serine protease n=1 Tax=Cupriavidus gilardii TaxID=82541 RepID=UPI001ABDC8D6|nr:trypsin-like peptidase domain-containing protein [Cupriavidus gilardii]MBO4123182.1 trypsin-like peptidase domain-containing protein [Cupriavidus gilardii]